MKDHLRLSLSLTEAIEKHPYLRQTAYAARSTPIFSKRNWP